MNDHPGANKNKDIVQELWDEHVAWSDVAGSLKSQLSVWRYAVLILTIAGAVLQTIAATQPMFQFVAAALGTICLAPVPILVRFFLTAEQTSKWLRARSISEGIKSEIYTYRAGAEPYAGGTGLDTLRAKVRTIRGFAENLELERAKIGAPTRPVPPALDAEAYINRRVRQQIVEYYRRNAKKHAERAEQFRWIEFGLALLAAVLGATATLDPSFVSMGQWVAVITTIGGTIAAHAAANRYDFQATTFFATARQLSDLMQDWETAGKSAPSKEWSDFVHACEEAISAENRAWMAKLDVKQ